MTYGSMEVSESSQPLLGGSNTATGSSGDQISKRDLRMLLAAAPPTRSQRPVLKTVLSKRRTVGFTPNDNPTKSK